MADDHSRLLGALVSWAFIFWFLGFHFQVPGVPYSGSWASIFKFLGFHIQVPGVLLVLLMGC